jgi:hypothetical protein
MNHLILSHKLRAWFSDIIIFKRKNEKFKKFTLNKEKNATSQSHSIVHWALNEKLCLDSYHIYCTWFSISATHD